MTYDTRASCGLGVLETVLSKWRNPEENEDIMMSGEQLSR